MFRIPNADQSLLIFGDCAAPHFAEGHLRVLVWNVWKGKKGKVWQKDLRKLVEGRDLILLQEATADPVMSSVFGDVEGKHEWHMAASFQWRFAHKTGVITGSSAKPKKTKYLRGTERELFMWTPKISLGTHYSMPGGASLLVINTHVVNFTTTASFVRFVEELVELIGEHLGPLLLAGDFNTWNPARWRALVGLLHSLQVDAVDFGEDPRAMKLDHVFARGLKPVVAQVRNDIKSSDHYPLLVDFEVT